MIEKKKTGYEIAGEYSALVSLINELTESEREITEEDDKYLKEEAARIGGDIKDKINGCCKLVKNCEIEAKNATAEKDNLSAELDRLTKRANARINVAKRVKNNVIGYLMDLIKEKKIKTELFTVYYQNSQKSVNELTTINYDLIPKKFLKRELNKTAIKDAVESGELYEKTDEEIKADPLLRGKLFFKSNDQELPNIVYLGGQSLVIR